MRSHSTNGSSLTGETLPDRREVCKREKAAPCGPIHGARPVSAHALAVQPEFTGGTDPGWWYDPDRTYRLSRALGAGEWMVARNCSGRTGTLEDATGLRLQRADGDVGATDTADEDRRLVDRAKAGDVRAFEALVRRYERWVFTLALRMVGDRGDAEDIAQEVFLKAYRGLQGFRGGSRFSTWLYAIASHHCLNHLAGRDSRARRAERTGNSVDGKGGVLPSALDRVADASPGPDAVLERHELRRAIQNELVHLTEHHRIVLILRDIQGMSYEDIAATLGVELGTVRSRLHRARMELKARLEPLLDDGSVA